MERSDDIEVDDQAVVRLRFRSGLEGRVEVNWREQSPIWDLQASSEAGVVRTTLLPTISIERNGSHITHLPTPPGINEHVFQLGYTEQLREALQVCGGGTTSIDAAFGRLVLEIVCSAYISASESGVEVPFPYDGPRDQTPFQLLKWHQR